MLMFVLQISYAESIVQHLVLTATKNNSPCL